MLSRDEMFRYARHALLPEFGMAGQERLKDAAILVVGAGGLGSPALLYLAAAGAGTLGIADFDDVDATNLQRQVIHTTDRIGTKKTASAAQAVTALNPNVQVRVHDEQLTSSNALSIIGGYDVVIDGTDNFPTRYLLNDACVMLRKPLVYGSVFRFEGQVTVFDATNGPCYRCLYPDPPSEFFAPGCAEAGVLGVLPGIIGTMQAAEAIKLTTGVGRPLIGRLVLIDALTMRTDELRVGKDESCPVCSPRPIITQLIDYEAFCRPERKRAQESMIPEITVQELKKKLEAKEDIVLVDVRQDAEHRFVNIGGTLVPLHELSDRWSELDPSKETIVYCRSGVRSATAVRFLSQNGFSNVKNLQGGILAWATQIDPTLPRY